jgi:FixJ family two-component response regulator
VVEHGLFACHALLKQAMSHDLGFGRARGIVYHVADETSHVLSDEPIVYAVDDDAGMRAALTRVFRTARIEVQTYASGRELLDTCAFDPRGVLLLDVMMPGMTGLELQKALREREVRLPLMFLTGSGDVPMAVEAMRNGAVDFLEKPFDNEELVLHIRQARAGSLAAGRVPRTATDFHRREATLTPREREVMQQMITGNSNKLIARELGASFRTIEIHRARVMAKMEAQTLAHLVRMALEADS